MSLPLRKLTAANQTGFGHVGSRQLLTLVIARKQQPAPASFTANRPSGKSQIMKTEKNYDFIRRREIIHRPRRRDFVRHPGTTEIELDSSWRITVPANAVDCILRAARDFQDYLFTSMDISVIIEKTKKNVSTLPDKTVLFAWDKTITKGFVIEVSSGGISLRAGTIRGILQSSIYLEDMMNLANAPFVITGTHRITPRLVCREVHSGRGIDDFPDSELNLILHAGYDTIVVFVKGIDLTSRGYCDLNSLIERAAAYGLDTALYNYMEAYKHPDDPDAEAFYDDVFGEFFRHVHGVKYFSLCGESLEFPSHDPATTGKPFSQSITDGIPDPRPSPGWYPCEDYPRYLRLIEQVIHRAAPDVQLSFSSYNWGYAPFELRKKFLAVYPEHYVLRMPFENFKMIKRNGLSCPIMDYTISQPEPGYYFESEAEEAHRHGIPLEVISNTAGATWDFGTIPYVPAPYLWIRRLRALNFALEKWKVNRYYETHHYGWQPNVVTELCKRYFVNPQNNDLEDLLDKLAVVDYGREAAPYILKTWQLWSDAMEHYVASNEDQYGPWRVGPAYPFIFQPNITRTMGGKEIRFPTSSHAHFGYRIIKTLYQPYENENQSPGPMRYPVELKELAMMLAIWNDGLKTAETAISVTPRAKRDNAKRLAALGRFIRNSIITVIHIKEWWLANVALLGTPERQPALHHLDKLEKIASAEIDNARDTIPAVECDSRLGWEPSMEYVCDKWHLEWKIRQVKSMLTEIETYRKIIKL